MKYRLLYFLLFVPFSLMAQNNLYDNTWLFGSGLSVNFTNGINPGGIPNLPLNTYYSLNSNPEKNSIAVSNSSGDLQFFVTIKATGGGGTVTQDFTNFGKKVFDKNGNPFPNGNIHVNFNTINTGNPGPPIVIPYPNIPSKYFLFYVFDNGLFYSIIDMNLNNGVGDVDINNKDIPITGAGTVNGMKMTAVQGCDCVWLIIRSRIANEYLSFKVDGSGINTTPVVSALGLLPLNEYLASQNLYGGLLKPSNNGKYLVAATNSGIELYDLEKCSGKLKNARLIDTMQSYGVCFSPDDSKLYVSHNKKWQIFYQGEVYQYDLNQSNIQSIANSKTLVMRNPIYENTSISLPHITGPFGDLKLGPYNNIYVGNNMAHPVLNPSPCWLYLPGPANNAVPLPNNTNCITSQFLHVIHNPNQAGTACNAELNYLEFPNSNNNVTGLLLQNDIIAAPVTTPDTITGNKYPVTVCFKESEILTATENSSCRHWDNGSSALQRTVNSSGTYWVSYFQDCTYTTDTFLVDFIPLPKLNAQYFGCEEDIKFTIDAIDGYAYTYTLRNENNEIEGEANGYGEAVFQKLSSGDYTLQIQTNGICDTTIPITLNAYPPAEIQVYPQEATITYGDSIQLNASGAELYHWWPSGPLSSAIIANPWARPFEPTLFTVLGITRYGCKDSATVKINIDYTMPQLIPNAFSPNGDGLNDQFRIEGITYQKVLVFNIFNRYGQTVFSTNRPDIGWDGTFNKKPCDPGVYYYYIKLAYPNGKEKSYKGDLQLIR